MAISGVVCQLPYICSAPKTDGDNRRQRLFFSTLYKLVELNVDTLVRRAGSLLYITLQVTMMSTYLCISSLINLFASISFRVVNSR